MHKSLIVGIIARYRLIYKRIGEIYLQRIPDVCSITVVGTNFSLMFTRSEIFQSDLLKKNTMGNLLYTIAVILIIIWLLGFLGILGAGIASSSLIHILLVIAVIAIILRLIQGRGV